MVKVKKVSVVSVEGLKITSEKLKKHWENITLEDKFYYVHITFLLLGLMHFIPFSFFVTANAYWMEKFRNVSSDDLYDASKRTSLQSHFASGTIICNNVPNSIFAILSALFSHKLKPRTRVLLTLTIMTVCFMLTTLFVKINTDSWQTLFFYVTFLVLALIIAANAALQIAAFVLLAKFPPYFMKIYLFGQGCAPVFNSLLQIMTLAVGTTTTTSALIYFGVGSGVMALTLVMFYFSRYNNFYTYFVKRSEEDITRDMMSFAEFKRVIRAVWIVIVAYFVFEFGRFPQVPVTALVVSEDYGSGSHWSDVYFVPVITYLLGDLSTLLGRVACSISKPLTPPMALILCVVRVFVFIPLILLCNAQPRNHLPVVFGHDWEYIIIQSSLSFSNGYVFNLTYLSVSQLMDPEHVEDGYLVLMCFVCTTGAVLSPLGAVSVDFL